MDTQLQTPTKQETQQSQKEHPEKRNYWEFPGDVTKQGQRKHTGCTQEIPRQ
jgi:hypothetical protein